MGWTGLSICIPAEEEWRRGRSWAINDGKVMIDKNPDAWEALDLVLERTVESKAEGGWLPPPAEHPAEPCS